MKKIIFNGTIALMLVGCTTHQAPSYVQATAINQSITPLEVPTVKKNFHLAYGNDPALERAFLHYTRTGKAPDIVTDGFIQHAYNVGQQPIVATATFQETVVSLEPGERFTNISTGDPNRWSYAVAISGIGANQQQHILIKPSLADVSTNMVITTDRRIYNLKLVSSKAAAKNISFWYPDKMVEGINSTAFKRDENTEVANVPGVNLNNLNFDYSVSCGVFCSTSWQPTRVFDDGTHTYIQFPATVSNRDMPVLFILNGNNKELVNYRIKNPYFVIDKLFKQAVLIMGTGRSQKSVTITNHRVVA
jgi:type IV secretion system protein VirB9